MAGRDAPPLRPGDLGPPKLGRQLEGRRHSPTGFLQENSTFNSLPYLVAMQMENALRGEALPGQAGPSPQPRHAPAREACPGERRGAVVGRAVLPGGPSGGPRASPLAPESPLQALRPCGCGQI